MILTTEYFQLDNESYERDYMVTDLLSFNSMTYYSKQALNEAYFITHGKINNRII